MLVYTVYSFEDTIPLCYDNEFCSAEFDRDDWGEVCIRVFDQNMEDPSVEAYLPY